MYLCKIANCEIDYILHEYINNVSLDVSVNAVTYVIANLITIDTHHNCDIKNRTK